MKIIKFLLIGLLMVCTLTSCQDDDDASVVDCVYDPQPEDRHGIYDLVEQQIIQDCFENQLNSQAAVEANLIGTWKLVGHATSWFGAGTMPCVSIVITEEKLIFTYDDTGTPMTTTHGWSIVNAEDVFGETSFSLNIIPAVFFGQGTNKFCTDFMYRDDTPLDGNMFLYKKMK